MPSRRFHSKSHHGCDQCKQRRIKCDEVHPACGSCRRKNLACVFQSVAPLLAPDPLTLATAVVRQDPATILPLQDLELLHYWHTATVDSLTNAKPLQDVIRISIPQEGLRNPFLMHGILAIAAVHLAQSISADHRQRYIEAAITHHNQSLTLCPPFVNSITRHNCHALFAFSCLLPIFVFTSHTPRMSPRVQSLADVVETLKLLRGIASVVDQARPWIEEGPMYPLLRVGKFHHPSAAEEQHAQSLCTKFQEMERVLPISRLPENSIPTNETPHNALRKLKHLLQMFLNTGDSRTLMAWPVLVDASYFDLLLQKQPLAVLVLGLFGSTLLIFSEQWWLDGTGQSLVTLAVDNLPPSYRQILSSSSLLMGKHK